MSRKYIILFAVKNLMLEVFALKTIQYLSTQEISDLWGITKRRVQTLCVNNRIPGAFRIGKTWAIPADAIKPKDARLSKKIYTTIPEGILMRKVRRDLKSIVDAVYKELEGKGLTSFESLQTLVVVFATGLLNAYINNMAECRSICEDYFRYKALIDDNIAAINDIKEFIKENRLYLDDLLSWVYQFGTKKLKDFKYKDTQFFTEKYMISTLVDSLNLDSKDKIIDPACGGGNFLLYSFDVLINKSKKRDNYEKVCFALGNLYGYEVDSFLAYVSAFSLKMKAIALIGRYDNITVETFKSIHTKIYYPVQDSIPGFLDTNWSEQIVSNCDNGELLQLSEVFDGANVVVTNPPFRTIKGMPTEQKVYLQKHYPMSKCDMCNAFIERVLDVLPMYGKSAMVTQNSWMYLDSYTPLRDKILREYTINNIWELGSNAFYNLSGEKANVALVTFSKATPEKEHIIKLNLLRNMSIESLKSTLNDKTVKPLFVKQYEVLNNAESRFDLVSTTHLRNLQTNCMKYKDFAVPMQGTSTGDAGNLIDYYWRHISDSDWVPVSKGGGYSRFEGLNSYCVKWGKDGEFIKNTKGSVIRNSNYFDQTQLVFSDTGTAGLNVRVLLPGQVFVASGPGIRITKGKELSHLAFLNSRFAAFYVRLISPKLTIAAGYIGQIPVTENLLNSVILEKSAKQCLESKIHRLSKRPDNVEFEYVKPQEGKSIFDMAEKWFLEDIEDEWLQLINEQKIENEIVNEMKLTPEDINAIDNYIGERVIISTGHEKSRPITESDVTGILGVDCFPRRTKVYKKSLGADGLIEYLSQLKGISCEEVYSEIIDKYAWFAESYIDLYLHALVLSKMKFREQVRKKMSIDKLLYEAGIYDKRDITMAKKWIMERFDIVHNNSFEGNPLYKYNSASKAIVRVEE